MTATIINFPATDWRKFSTTIAATGRMVESWEVVEGDRRANIMRDGNGFYWRAYAAIKHQKLTPRQRFRPLTEWTSAVSLSAAMTAANFYIAA